MKRLYLCSKMYLFLKKKLYDEKSIKDDLKILTEIIKEICPMVMIILIIE